MGTLLWQEFVESGLPNELGELGRTGSSWRWAVYPWQVFIHPLGWTASVVQALVIANTLFQQHKRGSTHGHHQMVNTKIRLIIFFAAKDGEALYSQQKQEWEMTVAQIMNFLLPNSDLN